VAYFADEDAAEEDMAVVDREALLAGPLVDPKLTLLVLEQVQQSVL